jgi:hypothetical protein
VCGNRLYSLVPISPGVRRICVIAEVTIFVVVQRFIIVFHIGANPQTVFFPRGRGMILFLELWVLIFIFKHGAIGRVERVNGRSSDVCRFHKSVFLP